jgi:FKBP-type peptidyl-prolyl cis-trans isomerase
MKDKSQQKAVPQKVTSVPSDAIHCISGLIFQVLRPGTSDERPGPDDVVQVLYQARTDTGHLLDCPDENGTPRTFPVREAIPGLAEAFQLMTVGQKMRVWIPAHLASDKSREAKERTLTFDLEMVSFTRVKEPPSLPRELTSPRKEE